VLQNQEDDHALIALAISPQIRRRERYRESSALQRAKRDADRKAIVDFERRNRARLGVTYLYVGANTMA